MSPPSGSAISSSPSGAGFSLDGNGSGSASQGSRRGSEASEKMVKVEVPHKTLSRSGSMSAQEDEAESSEEEGLNDEGGSVSSFDWEVES